MAARDEHIAFVQTAKQDIGEIQDMISALRERAENAFNATALATGGEQSGSQSGQAAFSKMSRLPSILDDAYGVTTEVVNDLDAYLLGL